MQLLPTPNLFYLPNFERKLVGKHHDDIIGTGKFQPNQMELNCIWQTVEESSTVYDVPLKNMQYSIGVSEIDLRSSVQLIFDVFSQIIDVRVKFCVENCFFFFFFFIFLFNENVFIVILIVLSTERLYYRITAHC